ncbi:MAG: hypothetical protein RLZZ165_1264 [Bacteroidota bacterium]
MTDLLVLLSLALGPIVVIFTVIFMLDRYEREPLTILVLCFVLGILIAVPALFSEMGLEKVFRIKSAGDSVFWTIVRAFAIVAVCEEGYKFLVLRLYAYPRQAFNEPYDGIMYAVAIGMGLAAIENVIYVWEGGMRIALLRMFTAVPAHGVFAHLMGYFAGLAKFSRSPARRFWLLATGLGFAILAHGLYDFFLMYDDAALGLLSMVLLAVTFFLAFRAIRGHQRRSPFRVPKA